MNTDPTEPDYLDAIFASIRTLAREIAAMKSWLHSAESAAESGWNLHFLAAARGAYKKANASLESTEARVHALGPEGEIPAPLDRLPISLAAMRSELRAQKSLLSRLESEAATRPIGRS